MYREVDLRQVMSKLILGDLPDTEENSSDREALAILLEGFLRKAVPDNHQEYTTEQLRDLVFQSLWNFLEVGQTERAATNVR